MRISIESYQQRWDITTLNPDVAAAWFKDTLPYLLNVNASLPDLKLEVWATTEQERQMIGRVRNVDTLNGDNLLRLSEAFREFGVMLKTREQAGRGNASGG